MIIWIVGIAIFLLFVAGMWFRSARIRQQWMKVVADEELGKLTAIAMGKAFWCKKCHSTVSNEEGVCADCGSPLICYTFSDYMRSAILIKPIKDNSGQIVSCVFFVESLVLLHVRNIAKTADPCLLIQVTRYGYKERPNVCAVWGGAYTLEIPKAINEEIFKVAVDAIRVEDVVDSVNNGGNTQETLERLFSGKY